MGLPNRAIWTWVQRFHAAMGMPPPGGVALIDNANGCAISTSLEPSPVRVAGTGLEAKLHFRPAAAAVRPATAPQAQLLTRTAQRQSGSSIGKDELLPVLVDLQVPHVMVGKMHLSTHKLVIKLWERMVICLA